MCRICFPATTTPSLRRRWFSCCKMFNFTFSSGNGVFNPFAAKAEEEERIQQSVAPQTITRKLPAPPKRPLPSPSISDGVQPSRKRGWAPTTSCASAATSQPTHTNGWIDTPSRYLEAASQSHRGDGEDEDAMSGGEFMNGDYLPQCSFSCHSDRMVASVAEFEQRLNACQMLWFCSLSLLTGSLPLCQIFLQRRGARLSLIRLLALLLVQPLLVQLWG